MNRRVLNDEAPHDSQRGTCEHCTASREGCEARQWFARQRCCNCTHRHPQPRGDR